MANSPTDQRTSRRRSRRLLPGEADKIGTFLSLSRIRTLLCELIAIESPSKHESSVLEFIEKYLSKYRLKAKRQHVSPHRYNLIASSGDGSRQKVLLNTHVDTVPCVHRSGSRAVFRGQSIYGRGACDAKGSVTAMLLSYVAVSHLFESEAAPVDLCLTVGEENSGDGSRRFVRDCRKYNWAIVGEPTDLRITDCHAGFVECDVNVTSARSHAFQPAGEQAIFAVSELLLEIRRRIRRRGKKPVYLFVPSIDLGEQNQFWSTRPTCNVRMVVNTYSRADISSVIRLARKSGRAIERKHEGVRLKIAVADFDEGLETERGSQIVKLLSSALTAAGGCATFASLPSWTDGSRLCAAGIPTVVFGPGSLRDAHTDNEKVRVTDVRDASIALTRTILKWHRQNCG